MTDRTHSDRETITVSVRRRDWEDLRSDGRDIAMQAATDTASEAIASLLAELADRVLGRPPIGSDEWVADAHRAQADPAYKQSQVRDWHLIKMTLSRHLGLDQTGEVINARANGASWQAIADVCGISRQAAHDRWARYEHLAQAQKGQAR